MNLSKLHEALFSLWVALLSAVLLLTVFGQFKAALAGVAPLACALLACGVVGWLAEGGRKQ